MPKKLKNALLRLRQLRPAQLIILTFLLIIAVGAVLLMLPIASQSREGCGALTALFTATSAVCVTGLVVVPTAVQWSAFGKVVILCLIQIGGLGFMTLISIVFFLLHRRISLKQRMLLAQSFGLDEFDGVVRLTRHVVLGTLLCEGVGALLLMLCFLRETSLPQALAWGVFHAISAFCNAGFDILGTSSMARYVADPAVNLILMALIVIGGLGFFVWEDILRNRRFSKLTVYSRLVLTMTAILIFGGAALFAVLEWNNSATLGGLSAPQKLLAALFQSVTLRTAGFESVPQGELTEASRALSLVWMLIGGSSGSTAGGAKTVTVAVLVMAAVSGVRGRSHVTAFGRTIADDQIRSALALVSMMITLTFGGAMFLSATQGFSLIDCLYETTSALGTVGTTTGLTPLLGTPARWMIICFMFFGRIGLMTISIGFLLGNRAEHRYQYAQTRVLIG
jgi:trk system potassium uptake protein TrkH